MTAEEKPGSISKASRAIHVAKSMGLGHQALRRGVHVVLTGGVHDDGSLVLLIVKAFASSMLFTTQITALPLNVSTHVCVQ